MPVEVSELANFVSIPSRRVGDLEGERIPPPSGLCFHPLKAGRRQQSYADKNTTQKVSIPSRRVGDANEKDYHPIWPAEFPSPQGGSETPLQIFGWRVFFSFPSPQGGSETGCWRGRWQVG